MEPVYPVPHSVEVPERLQQRFLKSLAARAQRQQPHEAQVTTPLWNFGETAPSAWLPHLGSEGWQHAGVVCHVDYAEEGPPLAGQLGQPAYFRRLRVSGFGQAAVQGFVEAMLAPEAPQDPLALERVRTWTCNSRGEWLDKGFTPAQSFDDLFLPPRSIAELFRRVEAFEASAERSARAGRFHKLGLLLMGAAGAGKSSLVRALARKYKRDLYVLALGRRMDDEICEELVRSMAGDAVLLVEDFDSLGFSQSKKRPGREGEALHGVTRSFFLNVLDGVMRPPPGTIICLTSNSCTGLDKALSRPGRVDVVLRFGEPQEAEVQAAVARLTEPRAEPAAAAFLAKLRTLKKGAACMAGIVDHLFRHPQDYLETFDELARRCSAGEELGDEGPQHMYM